MKSRREVEALRGLVNELSILLLATTQGVHGHVTYLNRVDVSFRCLIFSNPSRQAFGTCEWTSTRTGHLEFWLNNPLGDSANMWRRIGYPVGWDGKYVLLDCGTGSPGHTVPRLTVPSSQVPNVEEVAMRVTRTSACMFTLSATYADEVAFHGAAADASISTSNFVGIFWWVTGCGLVQKIRLSEWIATRGSFEMILDSVWPQSVHLSGTDGTKPSKQAFGTWERSWTRTAHFEFWLTNTALDDSSFFGGIGYVVKWVGDLLKLTRSSGSTYLDLVDIYIAESEVFLEAEGHMWLRRE